jgi:hypothetical protein
LAPVRHNLALSVTTATLHGKNDKKRHEVSRARQLVLRECTASAKQRQVAPTHRLSGELSELSVTRPPSNGLDQLFGGQNR